MKARPLGRLRVVVAVGLLVGVALVAWGAVRMTRTYSVGHDYGLVGEPLRCHPLDGIPGATQPDNDCNAHNLGRLAQGAAAVAAGTMLILGVAVWVLVRALRQRMMRRRSTPSDESAA